MLFWKFGSFLVFCLVLTPFYILNERGIKPLKEGTLSTKFTVSLGTTSSLTSSVILWRNTPASTIFFFPFPFLFCCEPLFPTTFARFFTKIFFFFFSQLGWKLDHYVTISLWVSLPFSTVPFAVPHYKSSNFWPALKSESTFINAGLCEQQGWTQAWQTSQPHRQTYLLCHSVPRQRAYRLNPVISLWMLIMCGTFLNCKSVSEVTFRFCTVMCYL